MAGYTAKQVNDSVAKAIARFQRESKKYGPQFQADVTRIIRGSQSFGDGEDVTQFPEINVTPPATLDYLPAQSYSLPSISYDVPYISLVPGNTPASAATASPTLTSALNNLVQGLNSGATALVQGTAGYYNALTQIRNIQGAAAAGVPVSTYAPSTAAALADGNFLGLPVWLWLGGGVLAIALTEERPAPARRGR